LGILVLVVAGVILYDSFFPAQTAADFTNVTYPGPGGVTLRAYLAKPQGDGPFPAVLLVHEFFGINQDIIQKADLLAQQGYLVLAVDAYRGNTTSLIPRAIWLVMTTPQDQISADIDAGYQYLAALPQVDTARIGAVGFCFGGTQTMYLGRRNPDLAATVIYYGNDPLTDPQALGVMGQSGPVLGFTESRIPASLSSRCEASNRPCNLEASHIRSRFTLGRACFCPHGHALRARAGAGCLEPDAWFPGKIT